MTRNDRIQDEQTPDAALPDELVRGTGWDGALRVFAVRSTGLVAELQRRHRAYPTAAAALGRAATAGAMMGAMLKDGQRLTIQVKGDGPLGEIVVDADAEGHVRGYVDHPDVHLPSKTDGKLDVSGAVGNSGQLYVIKDLGLKEPYRGGVPLVSGELGEDFAYYFAVSEQIPSAVGLGVLIDRDGSVLHAGGFIVQVMPGADEKRVEELERAVASMPHVTRLLGEGVTPEGLLRRLVGDELTVHPAPAPVFACRCSRERVERTLLSLGPQELRAIMEEDGRAEVHCHFCNETYVFELEELKSLLSRMDGTD
jgi:molecular chaperone Hsp33